MNAKVSASSAEITCPKCEETIPQPDCGSLFWTVSETRSEVSCPFCHVTLKVRIPKDKK